MPETCSASWDLICGFRAGFSCLLEASFSATLEAQLNPITDIHLLTPAQMSPFPPEEDPHFSRCFAILVTFNMFSRMWKTSALKMSRELGPFSHNHSSGEHSERFALMEDTRLRMKMRMRRITQNHSII